MLKKRCYAEVAGAELRSPLIDCYSIKLRGMGYRLVYPRNWLCSHGGGMNLKIAKWGNSLALRIPAVYVRRLGLKEGDEVQVRLTVDGGISIRTAKWERIAFAKELALTREAMPMTESVLDELRHGARY